MKVYLIGSLRNPDVPYVGNSLRELGFDVFDDWHGAGPEADDAWQQYEQIKGRNYREALYDRAATNVYEFDKKHLDESALGILLLPAGKSGHMELGYLKGQGKPCLVLMHEEPERWDLMYRLFDKVCFSREELLEIVQEWFPQL